MTPPQRILHLLADPGNLDLSTQLEYLIEHQVAEGHDVRVILLAQDTAVQQALASRGATTRLIRRRWKLDPFAGKVWASELRKWQPTIAHLWGNTAMPFASVTRLVSRTPALLVNSTGVPHSGDPLARKDISEIDTFIVDTEHTAREYAVRGIADQKICVIRPGINSVGHKGLTFRGELLQKLGLPADSQLIAVGGPLTRSQLIDEAIWCFELVRTLHEKACLLVLGDGPEQASLERYARLVSEPRAIRFHAVTSELHAVLSSCDVYWQTGAKEKVPTMMLSAMASGVPVVASDTPSLREVMSDGENGFLVPAGSRSALGRRTDQLLANSALAQRFVDAAICHMTEHFPVDQMLSCYDAAYENLLVEARCSS